jgi:hypothetical protein
MILNRQLFEERTAIKDIKHADPKPPRELRIGAEGMRSG